MPIKICPKCGYKTEKEEEAFLLACPKCGAFYGAANEPEQDATPTLGTPQKQTSGKTVRRAIISLALLLILGAGFQAGKQYLVQYIPLFKPSAPKQEAPRPEDTGQKPSPRPGGQQPQTPPANTVAPQKAPPSQPQATTTPPVTQPKATTTPEAPPEKPETVEKKPTPPPPPEKAEKRDAVIDAETDEAAERAALERKKKTTDYGILTITAQQDTTVFFRIPLSRERLGPYTVRKGKPLDVKLKKGSYVAEIHQGGKRSLTSINFIGNAGSLDL